MRIFILVFVSFLFIHPLYTQKEDFQTTKLPAVLVDNANAIIRLQEVNVDVRSLRDVRIKERYVITVLNKAGRRLVQDYIYYNNDIRVRSAEAYVYNAAGREIRRYRRRDFKDVSAVDDISLYSDSRVLLVDYTPTTYPYTIDISYEVSRVNSLALRDHHFISTYDLSVEKSSYTLTYNPSELSINYKEVAFDGYDIIKEKVAGRLHYEAKNLPVIRYEEYSPPLSTLAPKVMVAPTSFVYGGIPGTIHNWDDFGKWFYNSLIAGRDDVSSRTLEEVSNLVSGIGDPLEKARIVYEYVQRNTRYISVQVGIGGVQPITAGDVDRVKYGDCKGLSNYTKVLLESVGITSYYTHIHNDDIQYDFDEDFASLVGNHVILAIPHEGEFKWIECTSQTIPFGYIGRGNDNRKVLLIKPDGGKIVTTKAYVNEDNLRKTTAQYQIDEFGNFKAAVEIFNQGLSYNRYGLERVSLSDQQRHYYDYWSRINNLRVSNISYENDRRGITFTENLELEASNYGVMNGDRMIFNINYLSDFVRIPPRYRNRMHPVKNYRGYNHIDDFTIQIPEGFKVESLPRSALLNTEYGQYVLLVKQNDDQTISYTRNFLIREGEYPKEEYEAFRDFLRQVNIHDNTKVVLIKK
jgi:transglutaminase-like putative cysteine protease